jgi:ArsR family metal-binding transcriptional regulator
LIVLKSFKNQPGSEKRKAAAEKTVLVENIEIKETLPCFTTRGYIRFTAQADKGIGEVIPCYLPEVSTWKKELPN